MAFELRDMQGSLWKNDKQESESHPGYTGSAMIFGKEVWINAWVNETKDGKKYFNIKFKLKGDAPTKSARGDMDDQIPF